jgi:hypothetical protein
MVTMQIAVVLAVSGTLAKKRHDRVFFVDIIVDSTLMAGVITLSITNQTDINATVCSR